MKRVIFALALLASFSSILLSQQPDLRQRGAPIGRFLAPSGVLNTPPGFSGTLDPSGWTIVSGRNGSPRFVRTRTPSLNRKQKFTSATAVSPTGERTSMPAGVAGTSSLADTSWDSRFRFPGITGQIYAVAIIGSDIYVGGNFVSAGASGAKYIARWNGHNWSKVGLGVNSSVFALAVAGTDLFVGGAFTTAGTVTAHYVAKWDGSTWSAFGLGMDSYVYTLAAHGTDVYAGGDFSLAGGISAKRIASWNGSNWSPLGSGMDGVVYAFAFIGSDLFAGGVFDTAGGVRTTGIAKWDGSSWSAVGSGNSGWLYALAAIGSDLYVGGIFTPGGTSGIYGLAKWDGSSWSALGAGVSGGYDPYVTCLVANGTDLYVGGTFTMVGTSGVNHIAKWNGSWSSLGAGTNNLVHALAVSGTDVYAGGYFGEAGGVVASNIAKWDGSNWSNLRDGFDGMGLNEVVTAVAQIGSDLYVAGGFTVAGPTTINNIAKWDGTTWSPLGSGTNSEITSLAVIGTTLYAGGYFDSAGGVKAKYVASWDGSSWSAVDSGVNGGFVSALAVMGNNLYVGGFFGGAGGTNAYNIAKWNGFNWSTLGTGLDYIVDCIVVDGSIVYAAGQLDYAGGTPVNNIAKWDGSSWSPLGSGIRGGFLPAVFTLAAKGGVIYAGGIFDSAGSVRVNGIARWNGSSWSALDSGMTGIPYPEVVNLAFSGTDLYAGGYFPRAGGVTANNIAMWDGSHWSGLGSGTDGVILTILPGGRNLYVGGYFGAAGGKLASCFTIWNLGGHAPIWQWANDAGGAGDDAGSGIARDDSGNAYVAGYFNSSPMSIGATTLTPSGGNDIFVAKFDANGNLKWAKSAGGSADDYAYGICVDRLGDVYVTGSFSSSTMTFDTVSLSKPGSGTNIFLAKYDRAGHAKWARAAGGSGFDIGQSVAADGMGDAFITGYFTSSSIHFGSTPTLNLTGGAVDLFVAKYDSRGNASWSRGANGPGTDLGIKIAADSSGRSYCTGSFNGSTLTFGSNPALNGSGSDDVFIVKFDTGGNAVWSRSGSGGGSDGGTCIKPDKWGNVYVGGAFASASLTFGSTTIDKTYAGTDLDAFLVKFSSTGNALWATELGGSSTEFTTGLDVDQFGNAYFACWSNSHGFQIDRFTFPSAGGKDTYIAKYDSSGRLIWVTSVGGPSNDSPADLVTDQSGNSLVAGTFGSRTLGFYPDTISNHGANYDLYVAKLGANPFVPPFEEEFSLQRGWNIISLPLNVPNDSVRAIFPGSNGTAFSYGPAGYQVTSTMSPGVGYWLKSPSSGPVTVSGSPIWIDTVNVLQGWNMIGSISSSIATSAITSIPPGMVTSHFFGYNAGYYSSTRIEPGSGYWVKVNQDGKLILSSVGMAAPGANAIKIRPTSELPPPAPEDQSSGRIPRTPNHFALEPNYPNPFNPSTVIRYELPEDVRVILRVYNSLGQQIATLIDQVETSGYKTAIFDARNLPSGVYFYRLQAGKFVDLKKMLLMK